MKLRSIFCNAAVIVLCSPVLALAQQGSMEPPLTLKVAVKQALVVNPGTGRSHGRHAIPGRFFA